MIEKIILDYLTEKLQVSVSLEDEPLTKYVLISRTGGGEDDLINSGTIAIQSYGESLYEAVTLNEEVKNAMAKIKELSTISRCKLNTDYNYTDTQTKKYRYQAVYDIVYY